jgi:hypothetical protein
MVALFVSLLCSAVERTFRVGQQVEAYDNGWYPGSVMEVGSGKHEGDFLIHFQNLRDRWFSASRLRANGEHTGGPHRPGPREGRYLLHTTGGSTPAVVGALDLLPGARYRAWRTGGALLGEGLYRFDEPAGCVKWITGPYAELRYEGRFAAGTDGRRHRIQVKENIVASNAQP